MWHTDTVYSLAGKLLNPNLSLVVRQICYRAWVNVAELVFWPDREHKPP